MLNLPCLFASMVLQSQDVAPPPESDLGRPPLRVPLPDRDDAASRHKWTSGGGGSRSGSGANVQVSTPSNYNQDEVVMRVNPLDRNNLVGGANDNRNSGAWTCAFYASLDAGLSWNELLYPSKSGQAGDPAVAVGPNGEVYFCPLEFGSFSGIYVGLSLDGGITVPRWRVAIRNSGFFEDKQFLIADASPSSPLSGNLYLTWTRFGSANPIVMMSSPDDGRNWTSPVQVSDSSNCQGSVPVVGPNGEVYVSFVEFGSSTVKVDRSFDGGLTWGTDVNIGSLNSTLPNAPFRFFSFPCMDVDTSGGPYHGTVYLAYTQYKPAKDSTDIVLYSSSDQGATWNGPKRVDDDINDTSQFFAWLDVDPNGNVNVSFYDRRLDNNDRKIGFWMARSSDGGATFKNLRVDDQIFDPYTYGDGSFIGDYTGVAASDRAVHPLWTDGRNATNDIFTSRVQLDFCGDTTSISAATGGQVNFTINPGPLYAGATYEVFGSFSGTTPGLSFGSGVNLPLNFDLLFMLSLTLANSPSFQNFLGVLDSTGSASATLDTLGPLDPGLVGLHLDFATLVFSGGAPAWASSPAGVDIGL